jgi:D-lyxose ketol-isomerase
MIWFTNLPGKAEIRIFTLAGDLVDILEHNIDYKGNDVYNVDEYKAPQLSGGEHAWDLITKDNQAIASGLYLFTVKNLDKETLSYGKIKEGKFLIIK